MRGLIGLRVFMQGGQWWRLAVDPRTLRTEIIDPALGGTPLIEPSIPTSPYNTLRLAAEQHDSALQDAGLTHLLPSESGVALTVDLCPSRKSFDFRIIDALLRDVPASARPVPIAFAVSGVWLEEHAADLAKLKALDGKDLSITWINHSMHHRYDPKAPLKQNFLLEPGTNLIGEVLDAEVAMLNRGLMPSVFFRFPGLVSDRTSVERVAQLGLIVVGSDAWLAKGEPARRGSIVLVHGNGNEPKGVDDLVGLLSREKKEAQAHHFLLLDLSESLAEEAR